MSDDAAQATLTPGGETGTTSPDAGSQEPPVSTTPASTTPQSIEVPERFKDKGWAKPLAGKTIDALFNIYDNAQTQIGKAANEFRVPADDAPPEHIAEFRKKLGVPEDIKGYELPPLEWGEEDKAIGDELNLIRSGDALDGLRKVAQANNVTPKAFKALADALHKSTVEENRAYHAELKKANEALLTDFNEQGKNVFGDKFPGMVDKGNELLKHVPPNVAPYVNELDAKSRVVLATVLSMIHSKYVKEDSTFANGSGTSLPTTKDGLSQLARELMAKPGYADHRALDHKDLQEKVRNIYKQMENMP